MSVRNTACHAVLLAAALHVCAGRADSIAASRDSLTVSANGKFVFVSKVYSEHRASRAAITRPGAPSVESDAVGKVSRAPTPAPPGGCRAAAATSLPPECYPDTGVYRNDGSLKPLWTLPEDDVNAEIANDGHHLVVHGEWASYPEQRALAFYEDGRLQADIRIDQLVAEPGRLPRTVSHFAWERAAKLDDARLVYTVETQEGTRFEFNLRSGAIRQRATPGPLRTRVHASLVHGTDAELSPVEVCGRRFDRLTTASPNLGAGHDSRTVIIGTNENPLLASVNDANAHMVEFVALPLAEIRRGRRVAEHMDGALSWEFTNLEGASIRVTVDPDDALCSRDTAGNQHLITFRGLRGLEFEH